MRSSDKPNTNVEIVADFSKIGLEKLVPITHLV